MNHFWLVEPGRKPKKQKIAEGGDQPLKGGAIVLDGELGWPDDEIENAIHQVTSMAPQARLILSPILAFPVGIFPPEKLRPKTICQRHDFRPISTKYTTKYTNEMITTGGAFIPELGTIFIS